MCPFGKELLTLITEYLMCLFVILVISHFGLRIWVPVVPVPGSCLLLTFYAFGI